MALERVKPHTVHCGDGGAVHTDGEEQRLGQGWLCPAGLYLSPTPPNNGSAPWPPGRGLRATRRNPARPTAAATCRVRLAPGY
eukprot:scaffold33957_cov91-Phaeocystis_antarctica.AAC.4